MLYAAIPVINIIKNISKMSYYLFEMNCLETLKQLMLDEQGGITLKFGTVKLTN